MPEMSISHDYIVNLLKKMISIRSALPHEDPLAAFIADEIRTYGVEPIWHEIAPGRSNVYAFLDFGSGGKSLAFSGHSDTVPAASGWEHDPLSPIIAENRMYGLGAINMKAGLACMMAAFKALAETRKKSNFKGRLGMVVTVDQEGLSAGARAFLKTEYAGCDAMLHAEHFYGDSEKSYLPLAVTGKVLYKLVIKGKAAHAFRPHLGGINAIDDAAAIISRLNTLKMREHPLFGKGTICTLKIEGGYKEYSIVVPEHCEVIITRLTVPGETIDVAVRDMRQLIESLELKSTVDIQTPPPCYEPYVLDERATFVHNFKEVYRRVIGSAPHFAGHRGIVDANVFTGEGNIPTIVFGPKGANHHCAGEYVELQTLLSVARVYEEMARQFLLP
ncbi:MAG: M20/M25/M40 family metallo-hydrolase [Candidatus Zixiibacteriota bacterium]